MNHALTEFYPFSQRRQLHGKDNIDPINRDYIQYLGSGRYGLMESDFPFERNKVISTRTRNAGQREFVNMLPLVCNDAVAILFMFDLSRKSTLNSIKEWYRQARGFNKVFAILRHMRM